MSLGQRLADGSRMRRESHVRFCERLEVKPLGPTYHPQHPWQRGSNENTNRLLRQYFPKGIDLSIYSQAKLNAIARRLNERPRKNAKLPDTSRALSPTCCIDGLNPQLSSGRSRALVHRLLWVDERQTALSRKTRHQAVPDFAPRIGGRKA